MLAHRSEGFFFMAKSESKKFVPSKPRFRIEWPHQEHMNWFYLIPMKGSKRDYLSMKTIDFVRVSERLK